MPIYLIGVFFWGGGGRLESIKGAKCLPFPSPLMHETFFLAPNCYSQNDVESDTEEDEFESDWEGSQEVEFYDEEIIPSQDLEEISDPHSFKFRSEGLLMTYENEPTGQGTYGYMCAPLYSISCICRSRGHCVHSKSSSPFQSVAYTPNTFARFFSVSCCG